MNLQFTVPGPCKTKNRRGLRIIKTKAGKVYPHSFKPKEAGNFEAKIAQFALHARNEAGYKSPTDNALEIIIVVYRKTLKSASKKKQILMRSGEIVPTTRPDLDNYEKPIMDALTGVIYNDDSQIVSKYSAKLFDDGDGERIVIHIIKPCWSRK